MKTQNRNDKILLLKTARAVYRDLKARVQGTALRLRWPNTSGRRDDTDGWRASIGNLGKGEPGLQIWLDHLSGHPDRKFNFCYFSEKHSKIHRLTESAAERFPVQKTITEDDMGYGDFAILKERLRRHEFGEAIFEAYQDKWFYFGIYDLSSRLSGAKVNSKAVARAADFFEEVARALPSAKERGAERDIYPRFENRKVVKSHLSRERSGFLANERKRLDKFECQVCGLSFADTYGKLGEEFAEAHHRIPLASLSGKVETRIEDLATVCSNCHRMLHRMDGKRGDVDKLRSIVRKRVSYT